MPTPPDESGMRLLSEAEILEQEFQTIHGLGVWNGLADEYEQSHDKPGIDEVSGQTCADAASYMRLIRYNWVVGRWTDRNKIGQTALCLSGGGIRSAAFALGVLQGLARKGNTGNELIRQFDYLSTVSGGGYIGSWLQAWLHRDGFARVISRLRERCATQLKEAKPLQRLRFNQNFLTPKVGVASADFWAAAAIMVRDLLLNWLVFGPFLLAILLVPRIIEAAVLLGMENEGNSSLVALLARFLHQDPNFAPNGRPLHLLYSTFDGVATVFVFLGLLVSALNRPSGGISTLDEKAFRRFLVLPVSAGGVLLVLAIASWMPHPPHNDDFQHWCIFGMTVFVGARLLGYCAAFLFRSLPQLDPRRGLLEYAAELAAWAIQGLVTGIAIWAGMSLMHSYLSPDTLTWLADGQAWPDGKWALPVTPWHEESISTAAQVLTVAGFPWLVLSFLLGEIVFVGLTSRTIGSERDREWLARSGGWFAGIALAYFALSWAFLFGWQFVKDSMVTFGSALVGSGLATLLGALSPFTKATAASFAPERLPVTRVIGAMSVLFLFMGCVALTQVADQVLDLVRWAIHSGMPSDLPGNSGLISGLFRFLPLVPYGISQSSSDVILFDPASELVIRLAVVLALVTASMAVSIFVNVNWFSLHALYRNRLVKTFLGASNFGPQENRNRFDGFSDTDNIPMFKLRRRQDGSGTPTPLFPVLNMTLNVLASQNLAWQERKAEPFTITALTAGSPRVGYRDVKGYGRNILFGREGTDLERSLSLGTAMAISGAAVSPNWGYHSSPVTSFLMMLFNVRLGWWMGNPKKRSWAFSGPRFGWNLFVQEALGQTDDNKPWLYLSDGGHFENLGLYEMIRRRCRWIVVSDAGADPECSLDDLGNAVRKISIDMGINIDFARIDLRKRGSSTSPGVYCALGTAHYPEGFEGHILYVKPGYYGREPADVRAYAASNARFPHESTINQWFGESQFESYRSLGEYVVREICKGDIDRTESEAAESLPRFFDLAATYLDSYVRKYDRHGATLVELRATDQVSRIADSVGKIASQADRLANLAERASDR